MYKTLPSNYTLEQAEKLQEPRQNERALEHTRLIVEATKLLIAAGHEVTSDPIGQANNIVYERESAKISGTELPCDCDECGTWVVGDHRCICGNRRVTLTSVGDFENMSLYAECY